MQGSHAGLRSTTAAMALRRPASYRGRMMDDHTRAESAAKPALRPGLLIGILCGAGAAFCWAVGLAGAKHGISAGLTPADLTLHRYAWLGPIFALFVFKDGFARPGGISWGQGLGITAFAGPSIALFSYYGFLTVPLSHGAVIQPSSASLGGLLLTALFLGERLPPMRVLGALAIVAGLVIYAGESATSIGSGAILGDLSFMAAGLCWAFFGLLLSLWRIDPLRAAMIVTVFSLIYVPVHAVWFGYEHMIAAGFTENLMQAVLQGVLAGAAGIYLFTRAVELLGPARAAVSPALVPGFAMLIGYFVLGEVPTLVQLAGFAVVMLGFALVQRR
jgi:drug/metabolite transporter (DMT)-like permease